MEYKAFKGRFRIIAGRTPQDPEKAVIPTILWININHPAFTDIGKRGGMLIFGWWDWSVKIGIIL